MARLALSPEDPSQIGPYRVVGVLGQGGMSRVYLGAAADGTYVAVKTMRAKSNFDYEHLAALFHREITIARLLKSPFIAAFIADGVEPNGLMWASFELVQGESLEKLLGKHVKLPVATCCAIGIAICRALHDIHRAGIVHRDITPHNVMVMTNGGVKLIDFGIALHANMTRLTGKHGVVGNARHMAPERWQSLETTPATDIFSVGTVLAEISSGRPAFPQITNAELGAAIQGGEPDLSNVPTALRGIVYRCLAKNPGDRPTLTEVQQAILREYPALGVASVNAVAKTVAIMTSKLKAGSTKPYPQPSPTKIMPRKASPESSQPIGHRIFDPAPAAPSGLVAGKPPAPRSAGKPAAPVRPAPRRRPITPAPASAPARRRVNRFIAIMAGLAMLGGGAWFAPPGVTQALSNLWESGSTKSPSSPQAGSSSRPSPQASRPSSSRPLAPPATPPLAVSRFSVNQGAKNTFEAYDSDARIISIKPDGYSLVVDLEVNYNPSSEPDKGRPRSSFIEIDSAEYDRLFVYAYKSSFPTNKTGRMRGKLWFPLILPGNYELAIGNGSIELGDNNTGDMKIIRGDLNSKNAAVLRSYSAPTGLVVDLAVTGFDSDPNRACVTLEDRTEVKPTTTKWSFKSDVLGNYYWRGSLTFPPGTHGMINFDCAQFAVAPSV